MAWHVGDAVAAVQAKVVSVGTAGEGWDGRGRAGRENRLGERAVGLCGRAVRDAERAAPWFMLAAGSFGWIYGDLKGSSRHPRAVKAAGLGT